MARRGSSFSSGSSSSLFASTLTTAQLLDVLKRLKRCDFPQTRWHELGLTLGLHKNTLDAIKRDSDTIYERLTECLFQWLSRADNVDTEGGATFDSLSAALKSMNENAAADKLDQELDQENLTKQFSPNDMPVDRPTVLELIELHELLINGQLEETLDADTIRKIRNAASTDEGMDLLKRAFEEHPTLLQEMRAATQKMKGLKLTSVNTPPSPQSRPPPIPLPRKSSLGSTNAKALNQPKPMDVKPHSSPVIELSSKEEVARSIESLHRQFTGLVTNIRICFNELVSNGKLKAEMVAIHAEECLGQDLKLSEINMRTIFTAIRPHYGFFNLGLLKSLVYQLIPTSDLHTELTQYIKSVDEFSESTQLKHIRSVIDEKLSSLPDSPTINDQTKPVVIKLKDRWEEMTVAQLKALLKHYFGVMSDLFSYISFVYGSFVVTLLIPASLSQSLIDTINNKTNSMSRLGILEVSVDKKEIPIRREDDKNFNTSLHESVKAGDSFEVSMLLLLGADPNSKDERGKSAVEIANEGGHTQIKEMLDGKVVWEENTHGLSLIKPTEIQCQEAVKKLKDNARTVSIYLISISSYLVCSLVSELLDTKTIKCISIQCTKITKDAILSFSNKIASNTSLEALYINDDSINDDGVIALQEALANNETITSLYLHNNPGITSTSAQSLADLLLNNHMLFHLSLYNTNIDTDGVLVLMESLRTNNTLQILLLEKKHKITCKSLDYYSIVKDKLMFK